ncbi:Membrane protein involved in the export of O-antigen and teichoic acid [Catalinimonas alkaloidigena]|uniref:Membrane protein involved in the export of O-antigen and teichoic acid n=1 Tax=Catalinimonas alkaloidigena TaxID=1075417 RepID=A0A1G8WJ55_9BACT|nr:Membrane protein involved in the export of O-antigen and teichoic acid [Catalinimonas alkaloidigena]
MGHEAFGLYAALYSLGLMLLSFSDLGLTQHITKSLAHDEHTVQAIFDQGFTLKAILTVLYPLLVVGIGVALGYGPDALGWLLLLTVAQGFIQLLNFLRAYLQARQQFNVDAVASIADRMALLVVVSGFLFVQAITLERFIYIRLVSAVLAFAVFFAIIGRMQGRAGARRLRFRWNTEAARTMLRHSLPFAIYTLLLTINTRTDQVMLERLAGDAQAGLYAGAFRWVDASMMFLWTVMPIFFAKYVYHRHEPDEQQHLFTAGHVIGALPMWFVFLFSLFHGELFFVLFDQSSAAEIDLMTSCLQVLLSTAMLQGVFANYSTLLAATGYERHVSWLFLVGVVINVVLNFLFIPRYGALAAAWASVVSLVAICLGYMWLVHRYLPQRPPYGVLGKLTLSGGVSYGVFWLTESLTAWPWFLTSTLAGVALLGSAWGLGLFRRLDTVVRSS